MAFPATTTPAAESEPRRSRPPLVHGAGGPPPARTPQRIADNAALAMVIFVAAETMLFAGLITAFLILRAASEMWPPAGQPRLPVLVTAVNTAVLLLSGYTMRRAVASARRTLTAETTRWLSATTLLGVVFLAVQGTEWILLLGYGLHASTSIYGATFYLLIGCHGAHVLIAVFALLVLLFHAARGVRTARRSSDLQAFQIYWLFVVGIWPILYVLVYLT